MGGVLQGLHSRDRGVSHYGWYGILSCGVGLRGRGENGACGTRRGSPRSLRCLPVHDLYITTRTTGTIRTEKSQERQRHTQVGTWYGCKLGTNRARRLIDYLNMYSTICSINFV